VRWGPGPPASGQPSEGSEVQPRGIAAANGFSTDGKRYSTKQVRPIFVEEADEIVVVTVYVHYF
jgi:outer membrane receptor for monomeric catechols